MRHTAGIIICLAGGLAFSAISRADNSLPPGNPYSSIVKRNVFGLNPLPPPGQIDTPQGPPPPKITLTGITTIFGPAEALFKVAGVKREGKPPPDESYIFTEGESQDDVEVTAIDTVKNLVTFNNHGTVQQIPLAAGVASGGGSAPSQPGFASPRPFGRPFGRPGFGGPGNLPGGFQRPAGNNQNNNSANQPMLTGDDQAALISAQRAQAEQQGNSMSSIFPPSPYDDAARQDASGQPPTMPPLGTRPPGFGSRQNNTPIAPPAP